MHAHSIPPFFFLFFLLGCNLHAQVAAFCQFVIALPLQTMRAIYCVFFLPKNKNENENSKCRNIADSTVFQLEICNDICRGNK